ncbi:unnamed protein product, partial [Mesorhabditis belari]|uniref:Cytochrome P450 n=1 Tax=Mesorhabditis belari TaxID=2138241 RepID=A0AAF3FGA1_9BILA
MGVPTWCLAVLPILVVLFWRRIVDRLRLVYYVDKMPGPFSIPILGTTWQFQWAIEKFTAQLRGWGEYYASQGHGVVRIWLGPKPFVVLIKPEYAKIVLESNELITKGPEYNPLLPWLGKGLLIETGDKWRVRRKLLTPAFHFRVLEDFLTTHDEQSKIFVEQLEKFAESGEQFDIFPYVKRCALDIICETAMGTCVSAQTNPKHPYVQAVQRMNELIFMQQRMPWFWLKPLWYLSGYGYEADQQLDILLSFTRKVIRDRIQDFEADPGAFDRPDKKKAFLDLLLSSRAEGGLTDVDIREEVDTFMFEGHDTTSSSMGWTLWCVAHHPEILKKIQAEVDSVFGSSARSCTSEDLKQLKYLEKVIKESLRLFPSVPIFTRRVEKDFEIDGHLFPKNCVIGVTPLMIHQNPAVYDNPDVFDPENFSEERVTKRHPFAYIPFSAGPRNCIGQKFALMEEKTMLSWFFRRFNITADSQTKFEENIPCPEIILKPSMGIPVQISKR